MMFGNKNLIAEMDEKVREQIINIAGLPGLANPAMTMPDAHWGYGFPIGGVAAFDAHQGGIISAGIPVHYSLHEHPNNSNDFSK